MITFKKNGQQRALSSHQHHRLENIWTRGPHSVCVGYRCEWPVQGSSAFKRLLPIKFTIKVLNCVGLGCTHPPIDFQLYNAEVSETKWIVKMDASDIGVIFRENGTEERRWGIRSVLSVSSAGKYGSLAKRWNISYWKSSRIHCRRDCPSWPVWHWGCLLRRSEVDCQADQWTKL